MNLIEKIDSYAAYENKIAHSYKSDVMNYKELAEKSDAVASYLIEKFGKDKTPVVVYGHKQHEMLACFLGCVKSGHAYVPVDSYLPLERVKDIIAGCGAEIVFCVSDLEEDLHNIETQKITEIMSIFQKYVGKKPDKSYCVKEEDDYYIIYTSGSTGKPKGVQISLSNLQTFTEWICDTIKYDENKKYVFMDQAPFSFDLSVMGLYVSLATGSTLYSIDKETTHNMNNLFVEFEKSNIGIWVSTPSFADMCLADSKFNESLLPRVEAFLFCGETLTNSCVEKLHDRFKKSKVINFYGPTEATVAVTEVEITEDISKNINPLPVGRVKKDCKIQILNDKNEEVKEGEKGEIVILGPSVGQGYYNNIEITNKCFGEILLDGKKSRYYRTGDEGYIKDEMLYYSGRMDFQVKLNGFRIELEDIDNNLRNVNIVENAVVVPVNKNDKIQYLAAAVVLNTELKEKEFKIGVMIKNQLKKFLPDYMIPRKISIKKELPMTVNGKVDRKKLMEEFN